MSQNVTTTRSPHSDDHNHRFIETDVDAIGASGCDCISYTYFSLAFLLFAMGSIFTLIIIEENEFGPLARFWLVGPVFLCAGFLIAVKTLLYLRRKRFVAFLIRESYAQVCAKPSVTPANCFNLTNSFLGVPSGRDYVVPKCVNAKSVVKSSLLRSRDGQRAPSPSRQPTSRRTHAVAATNLQRGPSPN